MLQANVVVVALRCLRRLPQPVVCGCYIVLSLLWYLEMPTPVPKTKAGPNDENKAKKRRLKKNCSIDHGEPENTVIGKKVNGIVDGSFDAGYLLTVNVDGSPLVLRGLVFEPGLSVPLSNANDVAPTVRTLYRDENVAVPKQTQPAPSGCILSATAEVSPSAMADPKHASQNQHAEVVPNVDKGQESSLMTNDAKEHMQEKSGRTTVGKVCHEADVVTGSDGKRCIAIDAGAVTDHKEIGIGTTSPGKISATFDQMDSESPVKATVAARQGATATNNNNNNNNADIAIETHVEENVCQEQDRSKAKSSVPMEPNISENADKVVITNVDECVLLERKSTTMVGSEKDKKTAMDGSEDNDVESSEFVMGAPRTTGQELIDVWQLNPGERCLEAREQELMNVVEAQLCGLATTGPECTWAKSITDGIELSGNVSDADEQPSDSLFG